VQIVAVEGFNAPAEGTIAIYVDNHLVVRMDTLPVAVSLPVFSPGAHSIVASLQDLAQEVIAESEVEVECSNASLSLLPLWHFDGGIPELAAREAARRPVLKDGGMINATDPLTLIWTCPEWEQDWVAELLAVGGLQHSMITVTDLGAAPLARNALVAVSQNDERSRPPHLLASYLLAFRALGFRVGYLAFASPLRLSRHTHTDSRTPSMPSDLRLSLPKPILGRRARRSECST
jgi:hypothetical protein